MKIRGLVTLCATGIASMINGCFTLNQPPNMAIVRDNGRSEVPVKDLAKNPEFADSYFFAALSANIYMDVVSGETKLFAGFCESENIQYVPEGWHYDSSLPDIPETPPGNYKIKGMKYQVCVKESPGSPPLAVVVFRGTDPDQMGDWLSNFRWVTRLIPFLWDQYDQVRDLTPSLIKYIREKYGNNTYIIATGHSLGGGLAQQAAYMSEYIRKVYAFNPSSVTGYYSVGKADREKNEKGMTIYRIYEHGEILAYLRLFMKGLFPITQADPKIVEIRYNLVKGNMVSQHSMKDFACKLRDIIDNATKH
ncbi:MAG: DUF6792 domain-containing protein [Pseudomonadota bacterium]